MVTLYMCNVLSLEELKRMYMAMCLLAIYVPFFDHDRTNGNLSPKEQLIDARTKQRYALQRISLGTQLDVAVPPLLTQIDDDAKQDFWSVIKGAFYETDSSEEQCFTLADLCSAPCVFQDVGSVTPEMIEEHQQILRSYQQQIEARTSSHSIRGTAPSSIEGESSASSSSESMQPPRKRTSNTI